MLAREEITPKPFDLLKADELHKLISRIFLYKIVQPEKSPERKKSAQEIYLSILKKSLERETYLKHFFPKGMEEITHILLTEIQDNNRLAHFTTRLYSLNFSETDLSKLGTEIFSLIAVFLNEAEVQNKQDLTKEIFKVKLQGALNGDVDLKYYVTMQILQQPSLENYRQFAEDFMNDLINLSIPVSLEESVQLKFKGYKASALAYRATQLIAKDKDKTDETISLLKQAIEFDQGKYSGAYSRLADIYLNIRKPRDIKSAIVCLNKQLELSKKNIIPLSFSVDQHELEYQARLNLGLMYRLEKDNDKSFSQLKTLINQLSDKKSKFKDRAFKELIFNYILDKKFSEAKSYLSKIDKTNQELYQICLGYYSYALLMDKHEKRETINFMEPLLNDRQLIADALGSLHTIANHDFFSCFYLINLYHTFDSLNQAYPEMKENWIKHAIRLSASHIQECNLSQQEMGKMFYFLSQLANITPHLFEQTSDTYRLKSLEYQYSEAIAEVRNKESEAIRDELLKEEEIKANYKLQLKVWESHVETIPNELSDETDTDDDEEKMNDSVIPLSLDQIEIDVVHEKLPIIFTNYLQIIFNKKIAEANLERMQTIFSSIKKRIKDNPFWLAKYYALLGDWHEMFVPHSGDQYFCQAFEEAMKITPCFDKQKELENQIIRDFLTDKIASINTRIERSVSKQITFSKPLSQPKHRKDAKKTDKSIEKKQPPKQLSRDPSLKLGAEKSAQHHWGKTRVVKLATKSKNELPLPIHPTIQKIANLFRTHPILASAPLFEKGGSVRDRVWNFYQEKLANELSSVFKHRIIHDYDLVTSIPPHELFALLKDSEEFKKLNGKVKLIEGAVPHIQINLDGVDIDLGTFHRAQPTKGEKQVNTYGGLTDDVLLSDFTQGAIYLNPFNGDVIYPKNDDFDALADVKNSVIRIPFDLVILDPRIILRGVYFKNKLHVTPDTNTSTSLTNYAGLVKSELMPGQMSYFLSKLLLEGYGAENFKDLCELNIISDLFPYLKDRNKDTFLLLLKHINTKIDFKNLPNDRVKNQLLAVLFTALVWIDIASKNLKEAAYNEDLIFQSITQLRKQCYVSFKAQKSIKFYWRQKDTNKSSVEDFIQSLTKVVDEIMKQALADSVKPVSIAHESLFKLQTQIEKGFDSDKNRKKGIKKK